MSKLRTTLLESCLKTLKYNLNRKNKNNRFFEFGKIYEKLEKSNIEKRRLGIVYSGEINPNSWNCKSTNADFYTLKNIIINIFSKLSIKCAEEIIDLEGFEKALGFYYKDKRIAVIGLISSKINKEFDINQKVYYASLDIDEILDLPSLDFQKYKPISKFHSTNKDMAFILDKNVNFSEIEDLILKSQIKNLTEMSLFDVYEGDKIANDKKSYAMNFTISNQEKTLDDKEIHLVMNKIQKKIENKFNATLRDK